MPAVASDHNHYALNHAPPAGFHDPSYDTPPTSASSSNIPPLQPHAYRSPVRKRPSVSTTAVSQASRARPHGRSVTPRDEDSPDPHDFYRRHQDPFGRGGISEAGRGATRLDTRNGGRAGSSESEQPSPSSTRNKGSTPTPSTSRINTSRHASPLTVTPLSATNSSPTISNTARNRQTSLKELVNKFNQNPDETPPLPRKPPSRPPSANSSPIAKNSGVRTASQSRSTSDGSAAKSSSSSDIGSRKDLRFQQRPALSNNSTGMNGRYKRNLKFQPTETVATKPFTSQSMVDLGPDIAALPRRPLFGEISGNESNHTDIGYGILRPYRRRGSEGSMHSPNPMFCEEDHQQSPIRSSGSGSAYYDTDAPNFEQLKAGGTLPDPPPNRHRRTRSDLSGIASRPPTSNMYGTDLSPPLSPASTNTSKRNSQSRIPISTRRQSTASDSGNSNSSTRNNSALGMAKMRPPSRIRAPAPRPIQSPRSPSRDSRSATPQKSPRRNEYTSMRPATSPRLAAYISAPMPKKSPPLRSSRPRQPVSSASTSASRARAVDRFSGHENGNARGLRDHTSRKPPELGAVDFAARRQKIQQAFTKTVKENEREEERRASMLIAAQSINPALSGDTQDTAEPQSNPAQETSAEDGKIRVPQVEKSWTVPRDISTPEPKPAVDSVHPPNRSVFDINVDDSPTLGSFTTFASNKDQPREGIITPPSDIEEPKSAVTARTSDSLDTFFEDEPQEDVHENSPHRPAERPTLVTHELSAQGFKGFNSNAHQTTKMEGSTSERDDQESIHIMLGETPVLESAIFEHSDDSKLQDPSFGEGQDNRWSLSSWTSSSRSRDERDIAMERIDENSPSKPALPTHLSISTAASVQTQQQWSPDSSISPKTARTTMDSDAYSTINRVLDHYHDPSVANSEMMHDVQHHLFSQSPELARKGGWDPKKVTQLYLQKLAKDRSSQPSNSSDLPHHPIGERTSSLSIPVPIAEKEVRVDMDEKMVQNVEESLEHSRNPSSSSTNNLDVDYTDWKPARASLSNQDDWDMSPSLGELELQAADSPAETERPSLPPKDLHLQDVNFETGRQVADSHPQLPPIEGLGGLKIKILPPQRSDSPTIPPPFPVHHPPPPPVEVREQYENETTVQRSPPSPSIYSRLPSSIDPSRVNSSNSPQPKSDPFRQHQWEISSAQPYIESSKAPDAHADANAQQPQEGLKNAKNPSEQKRLTRRRHIIKELVDTEQSFGQDMKVVDDIYKGTSNVIIISAEDVKTLFGNSDQIISFSTDFLDALKQAAKPTYILPKTKRFRSNRISNSTTTSGNTDDQSSINGPDLNDDDRDRRTCIGEAFRDYMANMEKVYSDYLKNHDAANQKLQVLQKNPKVQIWLKECRAYATDLTSAWDLDSLLVKPVQRVLKYPLLLDQLIEVTPEDHPDFPALDIAAREMKGMSMRINEMKKRADLFEQATNNNRKRKESDVRTGFSKAFGRRTEKLRQQVGLSDMVEDKAYAKVAEKFGDHFFQLQVVMRDVEMYTHDVQTFMSGFCDFALAMEAHIDVGQTSYPETESRWRRFRMTTTEMSQTALQEHVNNVRKSVVEPMTALLKLQDGPQKLMQKRDKRIMDYARFKAIKDRGDKPDKKTIEQGEQFMAINDTLKDELPKLFALTAKLVAACLNSFVQLQLQWLKVWRRRLSQAIDEANEPGSVQKIVATFEEDHDFFKGKVECLSVCNGSMLSDTALSMNFSSPGSTLNGNDYQSQRHASLDSRHRAQSLTSDKSPRLPQPDFGVRGNGSGSFFTSGDNSMTSLHREGSRRVRANSSVSGHSPRTPEVPGSYRSNSSTTTLINSTASRPLAMNNRTATDPSLALRVRDESALDIRLNDESALANRLSPRESYAHAQQRPGSPTNRYSGFFSSAMPLSDSPSTGSPTISQSHMDDHIMFLAASVYEFKIDRERQEAGYPYLTYIAGEIFDVIAEKGELWLARNQDDANKTVGWIWNKHFAKLSSNS